MAQTIDTATLRQSRLFSRLNEAELKQIADQSRLRPLKKGEMLFEQETPADAFFLVLSGWVTLYRMAATGERAVLGIFGRGETIAEAAMFLGGGYPASAEAAEDSVICVFSRAAFEASLAEYPNLALGMLAAVSIHLHHLVLHIEQLKTRSGVERLASFLLGLCKSQSENCEIILPYDKTLVAGRLGMQPESLSRNLAQLAPHGVSVNRNVVTIADPADLARRIDSGAIR